LSEGGWQGGPVSRAPPMAHHGLIGSEPRAPTSRGEQHSMTRSRDGGAMTPPAKYRALLAAVVAAIVAVSTAIFVGVSSDEGTKGRGGLTGRGGQNNPAAPASTGTWVGS